MADESDCEPGVSEGSANSANSANNAIMALNVASIAAIPWEELSDGSARGCLLEMAYAGADVGAFSADGRWWVRLGSRVESCAAWATRFCV